ncbi:PepSY domain-containing protein [Nostoc sp. C057]|uniref:PepSY-associated TM helix domain-containing protein n=1 Tax=Nostoc sp. C057 TaxID=2576903 RepID=UPI0015C3CD5B|nr:PepSY-associated TM helix domain-containing protein [Nostoc sp. C057]QLE49541.1 PepSY domain-containing protein [Nostoc sp. C057]
MKSKTFRNWAFTLHRYLGLAMGFVLIIIGLTGSLLVFQKEINHFLVAQQFGHISPQEAPLPLESVVNTVKAEYDSSRKDLKLNKVYIPSEPNEPIMFAFVAPDDKGIDVIVNPYTGAIMGERSDRTLILLLYELHYNLMAGDIGMTIVGVIAFLLLVLSITGVILWPGWRRLIAGFKIKWNAHPKRLNFDIHKVVGIITVVFLTLTAFTGFCWNFYDFTEPIIYAVTFTKKQPEPVSVPKPGQLPLRLTEQLKIADAALPGAMVKSISFPSQPEDSLTISFKLPQENAERGQSNVYLDQYTGKVLRVDNALKMPLGDRILNSFIPLHYGTFGGLSTRILYVFVGLSPLILFISGFVMYQHRYREKSVRHNQVIELSKNHQD